MDTNSGEIIDVLERDRFIKQVIDVIQHLKDNNQGMMFSIEGIWGIGKSFILNRIENDLLNQYHNEYLILKYDCWKYDYYEEPLIALVANLSDQIQALSQKVAIQDKIKEAFGVLTVCLGQIGLQLVKNKLGIDVEKFMKDNDIPGYDPYSGLKTALSVLKNTLKTIAGSKKIILLVDELDRCLPPYQIKVLERLHHLFLGSSCVVVLAVNAEQLEATVHKLYGEGILADKYLKKIIAFSLKLDCGTVSEEIVEKYDNVLAQYPVKELATRDEVINFLKMLFLGLDIRTTEKIWEKAQLIHSLVFSEEENRIDFLCYELLWLVMKEYKEEVYFVRDDKRDDGVYGVNLLSMKYDDSYTGSRVALPSNIHDLFDWLVPDRRYNSFDGWGRTRVDVFFPHCLNIRDFIVGYWCEAIDSKRFRFKYENTESNEAKEYVRNIGKIKQFVALAEMMR